MLIKSADDKSARIALLEGLQDSLRHDERQKAWARDELLRLRRLVQGARATAHCLDDYLGASRHYAVLHDLRLAIGDEFALIDHLLIGRPFDFYLLDGSTQDGEPLIEERDEQCRRRGRLLATALESLGISGRVSGRPTFHHVALVDSMAPMASGARPPGHGPDAPRMMTIDEFRRWHERRAAQDNSFASVLTGAINARAGETVEAWGRQLAELHRPADPLQLPEFMAPRDVEAVPGVARSEAPRAARAKGRKRAAERGDRTGRKLVCATCGVRISYAEGRFCWKHEQRFGGLQYCREHQAAFG